eukprot:g3545.t1
MRVLVVDAFPAKKDQKYATFFYQSIKDSFAKLDVDAHVIFRKYDQLQDYIYELNTKYTEQEALKKFDALDIVFVTGDAKGLPYDPLYSQVYILSKMCFNTGKCFFGSAFGAHMLGFLCATGGQRMNIISGSPSSNQYNNTKTGAEDDQPVPIAPHDALLDEKTGDIFKFNASTKQWEPFASSCLKERLPGVRPPGRIYTPIDPTHKLVPRTQKRRGDEVVVKIRTRFIQHWSTAKIPRRSFIVPSHNVRDLDEKTILTSPNRFEVIADSEYGPIIIECKHLFGTQFYITPKYEVTSTVLFNFIEEKYCLMRELEHLDACGNEVLQRSMTYVNPADDNGGKKRFNKRSSKSIKKRPMSSKILRKVNVNTKRWNVRPVSASALERTKVNADALPRPGTARARSIIQRGTTSANNKTMRHSRSMMGFTTSRRYSRQQQSRGDRIEFRRVPRTHSRSNKNNRPASHTIRSNTPKEKSRRRPRSSPSNMGSRGGMGDTRGKEFGWSPLPSSTTITNQNQSGTTGYNPTLSSTDPQERAEAWRRKLEIKYADKLVPGHIDTSNDVAFDRRGGDDDNDDRDNDDASYMDFDDTFLNATYLGGDSEIDEELASRLQGSGHQVLRKVEVNKRMPPKPYSTWKKFSKLIENDKGKYYSVTASSRYISSFEQERRDYMNGKKKWMANKGFQATFGKATASLKPLGPGINSGTPYVPWLKHKFRDEDKQGFVGGQWRGNY